MVTGRKRVVCLVLAAAVLIPAAFAQKAAMPATPAQPATPLPPSPTPAITPAPLPAAPPIVAPAPADRPARYESSRDAERREYSFEDETVDGFLAAPEAASVAAPPPDVPAYSDLCKATPRPPWCADSTAPKGGDN